MTTDQLNYFYEVAKCLNFSQAARNLYISQPNLTKYIANLEKELGFRLFDRSTHHCRLTQEGQDFLHATEHLFYQLHSNIEIAKLRAQNPYEIIRIGIAQDEFPPRRFMRYLNEENVRPGSKLRYVLHKGNYMDLIGDLREHMADLIVTTDRNVRSSGDFDYLALRPFHMLLAIHDSNPKSRLKQLTPKDCTDEMLLICIPEGKDTPMNRVEEIQWKTGVQMNLGIVYSPADVLLNVQIGVGVGIIPSVVDFTQYHDISYHAFEPWNHTEQVLAWRRDDTRPEILSFVDSIRQMAPFQEAPDVKIYGLSDDD